jgi:exosome complex exonuclease DIS3/RRP44
MDKPIKGILKFASGSQFIITDSEIVDVTKYNKFIVNCLPGDRVELNKNKLNVIERANYMIPGILHISSKISYGITGKGNILKKFTPFDTNLPCFLVSTKKQFQADDIYIIAKFEYWKNNMCHGSIVKYIGNVGDISTEFEYIKLCATSSFSNIKNLDLSCYQNDNIKNRIDMRKKTIYSIDPVGCKDIDDALHIESTDNGGYELGIHIADVSAFIPQDSPLDIEISKRIESIYLSDQQINMLPDILSLNKFSLIENEDRPAFSIIVSIDNHYNIREFKFCRSLINVSENLSYEQAQNYIDKKFNKYKSLNMLYDVARSMNKSNNHIFDSHNMVEIYMIMANSFAAKQIYGKYGSKSIMRRHNTTNTSKIIDSNIPANILSKINIYNYEKAEYCFAIGDFKHSGLQEEYYTHFTSPIRRYVDILVHRMLSDTYNPISCANI